MIKQIRSFNDHAVAALSHPVAVACWWLASAGSAIWSVISFTEIALTLALSFLALAYGSAIAERQLRTEKTDKERDQALHDKVSDLIRAIPGAHDELADSEPDVVD